MAEHHDAGADHVCVQVFTPGMDVFHGEAALPRAGWRALAEVLL